MPIGLPQTRRPLRLHASALVAVATILGAACEGASSPPPSDAPDVGSSAAPDAGPAGPPASLTLGVGERALAEVADGDTVPLARGFQGLQHVWVSLRARHFDPEHAIVSLSLARASDAERVSEPFRARIALEPMVDGDGVGRLGMQLVVPDPSQALGEELVLSASVENRAGASASASATVRVQWEEELRGTTP